MTEHEHSHKKSESFTIKKDTLWMIGTFVFAILFVISIATGGFSGSSSSDNNAPSGAEQQEDPEPSQVAVSADDDAVLGDDDAPVTIIEFSDYECPFCKRFWSNTLPQIKEEYIDTGKAKLVYRDFPLTRIHPMAQPAAEAAECVGEAGGDDAYYEMHDKIFENQASLSESNLISWADELGYDISDCLTSGEMEDEVNKDLQDASAAGGRGTPYFVINGKPVSGAQPFSVFKQVIDSEL